MLRTSLKLILRVCRLHEGNILSEELLDEIELAGIGKLLALPPHDEVNSLARLHLAVLFRPQ